MSLNFIHKPDYFLSAQLFIRHLESYIEKYPELQTANFDLQEIYQLFRQDFASASTNLEGILNIADEYKVDTIEGDQKIIQKYTIDSQSNTLTVQFNTAAHNSLKNGKPIIPPDATLQE